MKLSDVTPMLNTPVEYPIEDFDYGMREFAIRDPNGYLLQFGTETAGGQGASTSLP